MNPDLREELTALLAEIHRVFSGRFMGQYANELSARAALLLERIEEEL